MQPQKLDSRLEDWLSSLETDVFGGEPTEERRIKGVPGDLGPTDPTNKPQPNNHHRDWRVMRNKPLKEDCLPVKESVLKLMRK